MLRAARGEKTNGHRPQDDFGSEEGVSYEAVTRRLSDVQPEALSWLWPQRILANKITLLGGDPGNGKSIVTMDIAARVTTGRPWPDCPGVVREPANVILMTTEDDAADTLRPRIEAAGGDASRVFLFEAIKKIRLDPRVDADLGDSAARRETQLSIHLQRDCAVLEALIRQHEAALVIVDPIMGYLPGTEVFRDNEMRAVLGPLAVLAGKYRTAFVPVMHLSKASGRSALYRFMGSIASVAQARMAHLIAPDPEDSDKRIFVPVKQNLSRKVDGLKFQVETYPMLWDGGIELEPGKVEWLVDEPVNLDADDAVGEDGSKLAEAMSFIQETLADGAKLATVVEKERRLRSVADKTLRRASKRLKVHIFKAQEEPHGPWWWELPEKKGGQR